MGVTIRSTTISVFPSRAEAEQAVRGLLGVAFRPDQVGIVLPDADCPTVDPAEPPPTALWAGTRIRSLVGAEIPDSEVRYFEEALQDGHPLVMVRAAGRFPEAKDILHRCGGEYMAAF